LIGVVRGDEKVLSVGQTEKKTLFFDFIRPFRQFSNELRYLRPAFQKG
jgi:hypothetical protein